MKRSIHLRKFCCAKTGTFPSTSPSYVFMPILGINAFFLPRMGATYQPRASSSSSTALGHDHKMMGYPEGARQPVSFDRKREHFSEKQILAPLQGSLIHLTGRPRAALEDELAAGLICRALNMAAYPPSLNRIHQTSLALWIQIFAAR